MAQPSKTADLRRLAQIADSLELLDELYNERIVIWARRDAAKDTTLSDLAQASRCARAQVSKALRSDPERLAKAEAGLRRRRRVDVV